MGLTTTLLHLAFAVALIAPLAAADGPIKVDLVKKDGNWRMLRGGKPFYVQGAGGDASMALLASAGANVARTWSANDDIKDRLDDAHKNGLAVAVGIWLGHERHGFKWNDPEQVRKQFEKAKAQVLKWKDHPATLVWGLGNEMEGTGKGDNEDIWRGIEQIAKMVKELDPNHPTMTVVAEIGGKRVELIHKLCPSIDIVGINSYGGCTSLPERYVKAGGTKPYMVTEYGPRGTWEMGRNSLGTVDEQTSTDKAASYVAAFTALRNDKALNLGSIAFRWGMKVEATPTWFGMVLNDGAKLEAVDALAALWGKPVANRCPQIQPIVFEGAKYPTVQPGDILKATSAVEDPEKDAMTAEWVVTRELSKQETGGDVRKMPPTFPESIVASKVGSCEIRAPAVGGVYRLYVYVRDGKGGAAVASAPFKVDGPKARKAD